MMCRPFWNIFVNRITNMEGEVESATAIRTYSTSFVSLLDPFGQCSVHPSASTFSVDERIANTPHLSQTQQLTRDL